MINYNGVINHADKAEFSTNLQELVDPPLLHHPVFLPEFFIPPFSDLSESPSPAEVRGNELWLVSRDYYKIIVSKGVSTPYQKTNPRLF